MPHHTAVHSHWGVSLPEARFSLRWWGCLETHQAQPLVRREAWLLFWAQPLSCPTTLGVRFPNCEMGGVVHFEVL